MDAEEIRIGAGVAVVVIGALTYNRSSVFNYVNTLSWFVLRLLFESRE